MKWETSIDSRPRKHPEPVFSQKVDYSLEVRRFERKMKRHRYRCVPMVILENP